ncbi:MAG: alpha/beta fold hydrolase [Burkholderiales bacterium]
MNTIALDGIFDSLSPRLAQPTLEVLHEPARIAMRHAPLLFIHGGWHGAWCWQPHYMPFFAEQGYDTYAMSFRGHGRSEGRGSLRRSSVMDFVRDIEHVVATLPEPPVIVAHSIGAFIALHYLRYATPRAVVMLAPVSPQGLGRLTLRLGLRHPLRFLFMQATLSCRYAVNDLALARHLLFSDQMPDEEATQYWSKLQDESYRLFLDALFLNLPSQPPAYNLPRLVIQAGQDRIMTKRDIDASARFLDTQPCLIKAAAHDLMLDPTWRDSAGEIEKFLAHHSL